MISGYEWTRLHAAIAVWDIAGQAEADSIARTLLEIWEKNEATTHRIVAFLDRIGPAATPALPRLRAELALPRRRNGIAYDEELQRTTLWTGLGVCPLSAVRGGLAAGGEDAVEVVAEYGDG